MRPLRRQNRKEEVNTAKILAGKEFLGEDSKISADVSSTEQLDVNSGATSIQLAANQTSTNIQIDCSASFLTYRCMSSRKDPKKILMYIRENAFQENGRWLCPIDSYELAEITKKSSQQNSTTIKRLEKHGWLKRVKASSAGFRLIEIDPKHYNL